MANGTDLSLKESISNPHSISLSLPEMQMRLEEIYTQLLIKFPIPSSHKDGDSLGGYGLNHSSLIFDSEPCLPRFSGINPAQWLYHAELYFHYYAIYDDDERFPYICELFDDEAFRWFNSWHRSPQIPTWENFITAMLNQFHFGALDAHQTDSFTAASSISEPLAEPSIISHMQDSPISDSIVSCNSTVTNESEVVESDFSNHSSESDSDDFATALVLIDCSSPFPFLLAIPPPPPITIKVPPYNFTKIPSRLSSNVCTVSIKAGRSTISMVVHGSYFSVDWLQLNFDFDPGPAMLSENATNLLMHIAQHMLAEMPEPNVLVIKNNNTAFIFSDIGQLKDEANFENQLLSFPYNSLLGQLVCGFNAVLFMLNECSLLDIVPKLGIDSVNYTSKSLLSSLVKMLYLHEAYGIISILIINKDDKFDEVTTVSDLCFLRVQLHVCTGNTPLGAPPSVDSVLPQAFSAILSTIQKLRRPQLKKFIIRDQNFGTFLVPTLTCEPEIVLFQWFDMGWVFLSVLGYEVVSYADKSILFHPWVDGTLFCNTLGLGSIGIENAHKLLTSFSFLACSSKHMGKCTYVQVAIEDHLTSIHTVMLEFQVGDKRLCWKGGTPTRVTPHANSIGLILSISLAPASLLGSRTDSSHGKSYIPRVFYPFIFFVLQFHFWDEQVCWKCGTLPTFTPSDIVYHTRPPDSLIMVIVIPKFGYGLRCKFQMLIEFMGDLHSDRKHFASLTCKDVVSWKLKLTDYAKLEQRCGFTITYRSILSINWRLVGLIDGVVAFVCSGNTYSFIHVLNKCERCSFDPILRQYHPTILAFRGLKVLMIYLIHVRVGVKHSGSITTKDLMARERYVTAPCCIASHDYKGGLEIISPLLDCFPNILLILHHMEKENTYNNAIIETGRGILSKESGVAVNHLLQQWAIWTPSGCRSIATPSFLLLFKSILDSLFVGFLLFLEEMDFIAAKFLSPTMQRKIKGFIVSFTILSTGVHPSATLIMETSIGTMNFKAFVLMFAFIAVFAEEFLDPVITSFAALYGHTPPTITGYLFHSMGRAAMSDENFQLAPTFFYLHLEDKVYFKGGSIVMNPGLAHKIQPA